jgi:hypothetical protein
MNRSLRRLRRRIPFFPFIPIIPVALLLAQAALIARLYRRVCKLESRLI